MYENVRNDRELRLNYEILYMFKIGDGFKNKTKEWLDKLKRANREYTHKKTDRRMIKEDGDGYLLLIECPDWVETRMDAEEWFYSEEERTYIPSPYDCTGQQFTCWYKLFQRNGKWMCYHSIGVDV